MLRRLLSLPAGLVLLAAAAGTAGSAPAQAGPRRPDLGGRVRVWVANLDSGTMLPIDARTRRAGRPVGVHNPFGLAITPNGHRLLVSGLRKVTLISTATGRPAKPITVGRYPDYQVSSPDGKTFYVAVRNTVVPVSVTSDIAGKPITVAAKGHGPQGLAMAPDGKTVYAVNDQAVRPVSAVTKRAGKPIRTGSNDGQMVITPDGRTGYVTGSANTIIPIDLATSKVLKPITIKGPADIVPAMVITPDGKTLHVTDDGNGTVLPISTATNKAAAPIKVGKLPSRLAVTPGGKTVYVATFHAIVRPWRSGRAAGPSSCDI